MKIWDDSNNQTNDFLWGGSSTPLPINARGRLNFSNARGSLNRLKRDSILAIFLLIFWGSCGKFLKKVNLSKNVTKCPKIKS